MSGSWLRKSVSLKLLCAEFGCKPVSWQWCKLVCRYWNRLVKQRHYPLLHDAFIEGLVRWRDVDAFSTAARKSWVCDVMCMLSQCIPAAMYAGLVQAVRNSDWEALPVFVVGDVMREWQRQWWAWPAQDCDPRVVEGTSPCLLYTLDADEQTTRINVIGLGRV